MLFKPASITDLKYLAIAILRERLVTLNFSYYHILWAIDIP